MWHKKDFTGPSEASKKRTDLEVSLKRAVRVSERTVCDPFLKHATVGYVVTWLSLVTT